jgi:predicted transposase/invertase (TIGR01784 family)
MLDLDSIELSDDSFIDETLSLYQSDILVRARIRSSPVLIYILVDHKSYPDKLAILQLLIYMVRIWEKELSLHKKLRKLPCIIPIVFYHGARKWTSPLNFASSVQANYELKAYVPDFQPVMFNLQTLDIRTLQGGIMFKIALKVIKYALKGLRPHLGEILESLSSLPIDPSSKAFLSRLFEYILNVGGDAKAEDLEAELQSVESEIPGEVLMTIAEQLIERGTIQGKQQILLRLLEKKFRPLDDDDRRSILDNKDRDKLDRAIDLILDARSVEEVLKPLA